MMGSKPMVIATAVYRPATYPCSLQSLGSGPVCKMPGMSSELLHYALKLANISFVTKPFPKPVWGVYNSGSWTGLLGMILNGSIDTVNVGYAQVEIRNQDFAFSYPTSMVKYSFIVKNDIQSLSSIAGIVYQVFSPRFWLSIFFSIVCIFISLIVIEKYSTSKSHGKTEGIWTIFRTMINLCYGDQGNYSSPSRRILLLSGCIVTIIVLPLYQNGLLTQLLLPRTAAPFGSAEELVDLVVKGRYKFVVLSLASSFIQRLIFENSTFAYAFRNAVSRNPVIVNSNITQVMEMVHNGGYVFPIVRFRSSYLMSEYCDLMSINVPGFGNTGRGYIFRKNFTLLSKFNDAVRMSTEYAEYINTKYDSAFSYGCQRIKSPYSSLTSSSLFGVFLLLMSGAGLAMLYLVAEMVDSRLLQQELQLKFIERARLCLAKVRIFMHDKCRE